jgi:hypothetical protein
VLSLLAVVLEASSDASLVYLIDRKNWKLYFEKAKTFKELKL